MSDFPSVYCPCCGTFLSPTHAHVSVEGALMQARFACPTCGYTFDLSGETCARAQRIQADHPVGVPALAVLRAWICQRPFQAEGGVGREDAFAEVTAEIDRLAGKLRVTDLTNRGSAVQHGRLVMDDGSLDVQLAVKPGQTLYLVGEEGSVEDTRS